jgi:hypothetical protein
VLRAECLSLIPDLNFSIPDPGSRVKKISDPGSEFKYFEPKKLFLSYRKYDPGMFIPDPDLDFISRGQKGTGSRIRTRNTAKR